MSISSVLRRRTLLLAGLFCLSPLANADTAALAKPLRIGITLHPYYSYVSNIVGDKAEVVPLIPAVSILMPMNPGRRTSSALAPWMSSCSTVWATTTLPIA